MLSSVENGFIQQSTNICVAFIFTAKVEGSYKSRSCHIQLVLTNLRMLVFQFPFFGA